MLMIVLDVTVVNVALPSIQDDLGFSQASLAWVVNAYLISFGGLLLLSGRFGDILGRKTVSWRARPLHRGVGPQAALIARLLAREASAARGVGVGSCLGRASTVCERGAWALASPRRSGSRLLGDQGAFSSSRTGVDATSAETFASAAEADVGDSC
jgi:MFS family permease